MHTCVRMYIMCVMCVHMQPPRVLLPTTLPFFLTAKGRLRQLQEAFRILVFNGSSVCAKRDILNTPT